MSKICFAFCADPQYVGLNHYHGTFITVAAHGRPSPSPSCVPRDVSTSCRPVAVCVEAVFLVFMASAMTSRHYLTSHNENLVL